MAGTRKDARGYKLNTGEHQRKDGRYSYSYTDKRGERHSVYSKSLAELRKKERKIIRDIEDGIDPDAADKITLNQLYDQYISQKYDLKPTTRSGYIYIYNHFVRDSLGQKKIKTIKYSDVKKFYYMLILEKNLKAATVEGVHTQVHSALQMAVRDGVLRVNPSDGVMGEIKKSRFWDKQKRRALTIPEQKELIRFLKEHRELHGWTQVITILLGTGMRIGECLGLRWDDLDFEKRLINVNHNLTDHAHEKGGTMKHIQTTKTRAGVRTIPMIDEVAEAFLTEYEIQKCMGFKSETIDGYTNFVFLTVGGKVITRAGVDRAIKRIIKAQNKEETLKAEEEERNPVLLPDFSAHHLRHTFCTRLCENETNLKVIQSIMGHADISTTMDVYAEATDDKKQEIITSLQGKIIL